MFSRTQNVSDSAECSNYAFSVTELQGTVRVMGWEMGIVAPKNGNFNEVGYRMDAVGTKTTRPAREELHTPFQLWALAT